MKPYNERLPLIDAAIDGWSGEYFPIANFVVEFNSTTCAWMAVYYSEKYLFTRNEFNQRAKELGYVNGYKYGVEYETNGEKPDLPDDVLVEYKSRIYGDWSLSGADMVNSWVWHNATAFRICDGRYKPKEPSSQPEVDDWNGEGVPPVGTHCEVTWGLKVNWHECVYMGEFILLDEFGKWSKRTTGDTSNLEFRPIQSERDKLIEAALSCFDSSRLTLDGKTLIREHATTLIDAGWRPTKD